MITGEASDLTHCHYHSFRYFFTGSGGLDARQHLRAGSCVISKPCFKFTRLRVKSVHGPFE
jgi:hypothetical protein